MKIQRPNPLINAYKQQREHQVTNKSEQQQKDQLKISTEAKKLQQHKPYEIERSKYVEEIKERVQSGEYKVEPDKTAQKMIDFWSKRI